MKILFINLVVLLTAALPTHAGGGGGEIADLTGSGMGIFALLLFVAAYCLVIAEEKLHLRKSKPVIVAAGIICAPHGSRGHGCGGG